VVFFDDYDNPVAVQLREEMRKWAKECEVELFLEIRNFK